jgi:hypothetical protein
MPFPVIDGASLPSVIGRKALNMLLLCKQEDSRGSMLRAILFS